MNRTFLNKFVYWVVTLILMYGFIYGFNFLLTTITIAYHGHSAPTFEQQPEIYKFLVFPRSVSVQIYSDKTFSKSVGTLDRAVQTDAQEIKDGVVAIELYPGKDDSGYVKYNSLSFLPQNNDQKWLQSSQEFLDAFYGDVEIAWKSFLNSDGTLNVQYTVKDYKYARAATYMYLTDGEHLLKVHPLIQTIGVAPARLVMYDIPLLILLIIIAFIVKRRIFRKI